MDREDSYIEKCWKRGFSPALVTSVAILTWTLERDTGDNDPKM